MIQPSSCQSVAEILTEFREHGITVLLTDATLGLIGKAVRVTAVDEDDNGELTITADEIPELTP